MESHLARDKPAHTSLRSRWRQPFVQACFLIGLVSLLIFLGIVDIVLNQRPLLQIDQIVAEYLKGHTLPHTIRAMRIISGLADPGVPLIGVAGVVLLALRRRWADLALWVAALGGGLFVNSIIKEFFDGRRPEWADPLHMGHQWQFPSGHVLGAIIGYGLILLLVWHRIKRPRLRITFVFGLVALLLLIGFSRLYVRDHYLGDVLAGYTVGLSWLALCAGIWAAYRPQRGVLQ